MTKLREKVSKKQTKDIIAEIIKNNILSGELNADDDVTQEELAEILQVSRMPVREAIQILIQEGFMEKLPNRHVKFVKLNIEEIKEAFLFIGSMEKQMAEILVNKLTNLSELSILKEKIKESSDRGKLVSLELEVHETIIELVDNTYITLIFEKIFNGYGSYAIEKFGTVEEKQQQLVSILNIIINKKIDTFELVFKEYYLFYAEQFEA